MGVALWGVTACGAGDGTLEEVDPEAAPAAPTWSAHIEPIMSFYCTACHAPEAQTGTAEGVDLSTCQQVGRQRVLVMESAVADKYMPPGGAMRVSSTEALTLQRWYDQGARCD